MNSRPQPPVATSFYYHHHPPHSYHDPSFTSLAYRPLQYPLQLGGISPADHQQHQQQQQQAQLSSLAAAGFHQHNFRPRHHHQQQQVPLRHRQPSRQQARAPMAFEGQQTPHGMSEDELAELQKASNEYQPETTVRVRAVASELRSGAKVNCEGRFAVMREMTVADRVLFMTGASRRRAPTEHGHHQRIRVGGSGLSGQDCGMISHDAILPKHESDLRCRLSLPSTLTTAPCEAMATADGEVGSMP